MENWRPGNWEQIAEKAATISLTRREDDTEPAIITFRQLVEAGADAMLEVLKESGVQVTKNTLMITTPNSWKVDGWLVFIPDNEPD